MRWKVNDIRWKCRWDLDFHMQWITGLYAASFLFFSPLDSIFICAHNIFNFHNMKGYLMLFFDIHFWSSILAAWGLNSYPFKSYIFFGLFFYIATKNLVLVCWMFDTSWKHPRALESQRVVKKILKLEIHVLWI